MKYVNMTEALRQVREKAPNTADAMARHKAGNAGFTDKSHLKAKGLIPRSDGTKKKSPKYEDLNKDDEKTIKPIIKQLQKSVAAHGAQAKQLKKDISDEKDLEEGQMNQLHMYMKQGKSAKEIAKIMKLDVKTIQSLIGEELKEESCPKCEGEECQCPQSESLEDQKKVLEEQLKTAEQELEELYIKEEKAYVIRFQRIADKARMVVIFTKQSEADMYADNIKKQGGKVFSNKLERIPMGYKLVDKK